MISGEIEEKPTVKNAVYTHTHTHTHSCTHEKPTVKNAIYTHTHTHTHTPAGMLFRSVPHLFQIPIF